MVYSDEGLHSMVRHSRISHIDILSADVKLSIPVVKHVLLIYKLLPRNVSSQKSIPRLIYSIIWCIDLVNKKPKMHSAKHFLVHKKKKILKDTKCFTSAQHESSMASTSNITPDVALKRCLADFQ